MLKYTVVLVAFLLYTVDSTNCEGSWSEWSECDVDCGEGHQARVFTVNVPQQGEGSHCDFEDGEMQSQHCSNGKESMQSCETDDDCCDGMQCHQKEDGVFKCKSKCPKSWMCWTPPCKGDNKKCFDNSDCCDGFSCHEKNDRVSKCKADCPDGWLCSGCVNQNKECSTDEDCCGDNSCFESKTSGVSKCKPFCPRSWLCYEAPCKPENKRCESSDDCCDGLSCFEKTTDLFKCKSRCPNSWSCQAQDCEGHWEDWEECSVGCGGGQQSRHFHVEVPSRNGGEQCDFDDEYEETRDCNTQTCPGSYQYVKLGNVGNAGGGYWVDAGLPCNAANVGRETVVWAGNNAYGRAYGFITHTMVGTQFDHYQCQFVVEGQGQSTGQFVGATALETAGDN